MKNATDREKEVLAVRHIKQIIVALTVATASAMAAAGPVFAGIGTSPS